MQKHNNITFVGDVFPNKWIYGKYEEEIIDSILTQIHIKFKKQRNLFINTTWFGPQFNDGEQYNKIINFNKKNITFDNVFFLATVDPILINKEQIDTVVSMLGNPRAFYIGNFETFLHMQ